MTPARFLKVTTVTSATLALLAGTAVTSAYAAEAPAAPATPAAPVAPAVDVEASFTSYFSPNTPVKANDGLLVAPASDFALGVDGTLNGATSVATYDLNKIVLELNGKTVKANVSNAVTVEPGTNTEALRGLGAWGSNNASIVTVDKDGNLTAVADGTASIGFVPVLVQGGVIAYSQALYTLDVTVANGVITVAQPAPVEDVTPIENNAPAEEAPVALPIGTPVKLADGALFFVSANPTLDAEGNATGLTTVSRGAFEGTYMEITNLDSLTIGSVVEGGFNYTNAAGRDEIAAVIEGNPDAALAGELKSSDESVISVKDNIATVVGPGTATLTFVATMVRDGAVVESDLTFSYTITIADPVAEPVPAPAEPTPAPAEPTPAPAEPAPAEPAPVVEEQPVIAPPVEATTDPAVAPAAAEKPFVYQNCAAVHEAGAAPIRPGDYGWDPSLDADGDGVGCEVKPDYTNATTQNNTQAAANNKQLANTGAETTAPLAAGFGLLALGAGAVAVSRRRAN